MRSLTTVDSHAHLGMVVPLVVGGVYENGTLGKILCFWFLAAGCTRIHKYSCDMCLNILCNTEHCVSY